MKNRGWSIRAKIMTLAIVPLVAITGLSVFGVAVTAGAALNLLDAIYYEDAVTDKGELLMVELQRERRVSVTVRPGHEDLSAQRAQTTDAEREFRVRLNERKVRDELPADRLSLVDNFLSRLDGLPQLRQDVDEGKGDGATIIRRYSELIDSVYEMFAPLTDLSDRELAKSAAGLWAISRARELLAREDAVISGAIADGRMTAAEHSLALRSIGARRQQFEEARAALSGTPHLERYDTIFAGAAYTSIFAMEESFTTIRNDRRAPIDNDSWRAAADSVLTMMDETEDAAAEETVALANDVAIVSFVLPLAVGLAGLICAAISLVLAMRTGRSVVRRLERLRVSALEVAHAQLPRAIAALRQPGNVVIDPSLLDIPVIAVGSDEVGQVGYAFGAVQRTAVRAAVDEASLRRGLSEVFLNMARRSQALLHRQLTLLDRMERRTTQPNELEDLFKLDHMATRMRRHAEALVILAGAAPGRGWRRPVPLLDVVRGATSEIEDYLRVSLDRLPDVKIVGRAVGDLIHLMAELLENATSFAPPHTRVRVHAEHVGQGLAIHVEDRGLGMSDTELAETNARLADPPPFDPSHSARLGLLVVAKLAARQGISVQLRTSPYGGVTAVVLVPSDLIMADSMDPIKPRRELTSAAPSTPDDPAASTPESSQQSTPILPKRVRRSGDQPAEAVAALPEPAAEPASAAPADAEEATIRLTAQQADETTVSLDRRQRTTAPIGSPPSADDTTATMPAVTTGDVPRARSADQVRAMMSAFQSGSARGRAKASPDNLSAPQASPAADTTAEVAAAEAGELTDSTTAGSTNVDSTTVDSGGTAQWHHDNRADASRGDATLPPGNLERRV